MSKYLMNQHKSWYGKKWVITHKDTGEVARLTDGSTLAWFDNLKEAKAYKLKLEKTTQETT